MNRILVRIRVFTLNNFLLRIIAKKIFLEQVEYKDNYLKCYIEEQDLKYFEKFYQVEVLKKNRLVMLGDFLKNNYLLLGSIILSIILFLYLKNVIIKVEIVSSNATLSKELMDTLEEYKVKRLSFKLKDEELQKIKKEVVLLYQEQIEWLEIKSEGMNYVITLEERIKDSPKKEETYCNVYAKREGIVKKISASCGNVIVSEDTYVREGDLLISGDITLNGNEMAKVCAKGNIYGEVWYKASLSIPKTYEVVKPSGRVQTNFKIDMGRNDYKIFRSKYQNYREEDEVIISILGKKLIKSVEKEVVTEKVYYTEEELNRKIDALVAEKINLQLDQNEKILHENILKKQEFDSTIEVEVFVTALVLLSS